MSDVEARIQAPLGQLTWHAELAWWQSQPIAISLFDGATASIVLDAEGEDPFAPFADDVLAAARVFLALRESDRAEIEPHVWQEYTDIRDVIGEDCPEIARADIWKNVDLNGVHIERRIKDDLVYVSIECNCEWEPEHGMQLVLQHGSRWVRVSDYSGHLTEGDSFACEALDAWMSDPAAKLPVRSREETYALLGKHKRG